MLILVEEWEWRRGVCDQMKAEAHGFCMMIYDMLPIEVVALVEIEC